MNFIDLLLKNKILIIALIAWFTAGVIKVIIELILNKKLTFSRIVGAGGMPSSHTSTVVALVISIGYENGINSALFAFAVVFAIIVIHDAIGVRLETGKQAKILNEMMFDSHAFEDMEFEKALKEYIGHTPIQAFVGAIVGAIVAFVLLNVL